MTKRASKKLGAYVARCAGHLTMDGFCWLATWARSGPFIASLCTFAGNAIAKKAVMMII